MTQADWKILQGTESLSLQRWWCSFLENEAIVSTLVRSEKDDYDTFPGKSWLHQSKWENLVFGDIDLNIKILFSCKI